MEKGTYAAYRVSYETKLGLTALSNRLGLEHQLHPNQLHTTLLYSRKDHPEYEPDESLRFEAKFGGYEVFTSNSGESALVILLDCPELVERHKTLMETHNATYDYPVYRPHITLTYNAPRGFKFEDLPPYEGPIVLVNEFKEELDDL